MNQIQELFLKEPIEIIENMFFFDVDSSTGGPNGDIDESKIDYLADLAEKIWSVKFDGSWAHQGYGGMIGGGWYDSNPLMLADEKAKEIAESGKAFLEIACGEALGLAPSILMKNPSANCLLSDASSTIIKACQRFINKNLKDSNINLAVIDNRAMPFKDESCDYITSFNGINSSSWSGGDSRYLTLKEIYRVLKKGGQLITVENEWSDYEKIAEVLKQEKIEYGSEKFERIFNSGDFFRYYFHDGITMKDFCESIGFRVDDTDKHTLNRNAKLNFYVEHNYRNKP